MTHIWVVRRQTVEMYAVWNTHVKSNKLAPAVIHLVWVTGVRFKSSPEYWFINCSFLWSLHYDRQDNDLKWTTISYFIITSPMNSTVMSYCSIINMDCSCFWVSYFLMKANEMHYFSDLFEKVLYVFRTCPLSIISSISTLYIRNRYLSF